MLPHNAPNSSPRGFIDPGNLSNSREDEFTDIMALRPSHTPRDSQFKKEHNRMSASEKKKQIIRRTAHFKFD